MRLSLKMLSHLINVKISKINIEFYYFGFIVVRDAMKGNNTVLQFQIITKELCRQTKGSFFNRFNFDF